MPIVTYINNATSLITSEDARKLREECDDTFEYVEAGWNCIAGYREGRRIVHAHARSSEEMDIMLGRAKPRDTDDVSIGYYGRYR